MQELVDRTGCRVQFDDIIIETYPTQQYLGITGPGNAPKETWREIGRLIVEGESRMPPELKRWNLNYYHYDTAVGAVEE